MEDYYQTLGVTKSASDAEIKAAYRKQALQWHPDRNKDPKATERFKQINEAYEVLGNSEKKATYDQFGHNSYKQSTQNGQSQGGSAWGGQGPFSYSYRTYGGGSNDDFAGFSDPFEIFEQFFGGGFSGQRARTRRQTYSLSLTFMEAVKGVEKTVTINDKNMTIKIPAGVDNGSRVRFGDFDIAVSVKADKTFKREGSDIILDVEIDFPDAVLGTTIEVPTIDDPVSLKIPAGTQPETLIRLRGRGIPSPRGTGRGDQYVRVKIKIPNKLTSAQRQALETFRQTLSNKSHSGWF